MLRTDAVSLALGAQLLVASVLTLVLWAAARRRAAALPGRHATGGVWLGVFAFLYGLRLLARTATFRLFFDVTPTVWEHIDAAISYTIPVPIALFVRAFAPSWRRLATWSAVGLSVFAIGAIASDAILHRPESARAPSNLIAIAFVVVLLGRVFRRGQVPSVERRTQQIGVLAVALTALADNLRGMGILRFRGPDLEPFGFTALVLSLGTLAAQRILRDARRLVAMIEN